MGSCGSRARHRRAGSADEARRSDFRHAKAGDADLVHGRHSAHRRHCQRARVLHSALGHRQCRRARYRRQHLPRPHQRAGRHRPRRRCRDAAALLRLDRAGLAAFGPRLGGGGRLGGGALRQPGGDEHAPGPPSPETKGSAPSSNRATQWGEQIVKPIFESKDDLEIFYLLAKKLGFQDKMFKNIKVTGNLPEAEDVLREINRGGWSTGYCGQSPERLKSHMANQKDFDMLTQRATTGPNKGDYYGLPWPCWGTPAFKHPGTPLLYNTNLSVKEGGGTFRPRFGLEREETLADGTKRKVSLLAAGSYSKDSEIKDGYPEFTYGVLKKLGWDKDLTPEELAVIQKINPTTPEAVGWAIDLSGGIQRVAIEHGCTPYGNRKAGANAFGLPDAIPVHRDPHLR